MDKALEAISHVHSFGFGSALEAVDPTGALARIHEEIQRSVSEEGSFIVEFGNLLWSSVGYRLDFGPSPLNPLRHFVFSFTGYAFPGGLIGDLVLLRWTRCLGGPVAIPRHCLCWLAVNCFPLDVVHRLLALPVFFWLIDAMSWLDLLQGTVGRMEVVRASKEASILPLYEFILGAIMLSFGALVRKYERGKLSFETAWPILFRGCLYSGYLCIAKAVEGGAYFEGAKVLLAYVLVLNTFLATFVNSSFDITAPVRWPLELLPRPHCARGASGKGIDGPSHKQEGKKRR